jgi:hypothetical protein
VALMAFDAMARYETPRRYRRDPAVGLLPAGRGHAAPGDDVATGSVDCQRRQQRLGLCPLQRHRAALRGRRHHQHRQDFVASVVIAAR